MDQATKEQFKWKFYRLVVILNLTVLIVAIGIIALFKAPADYRVPVVLICLTAAILAALYFRSQYRKTQEWLQSMQ